MGDLGNAVQRKPVLSVKIAVLNFVKEGIHPIQTHGAGWRLKQRQGIKNSPMINFDWSIPGLFFVGRLTHLQSIARPFGQPRVVLTIDRACDPSPQALIIFAGRYQSVQKIYLPTRNNIKAQCNIYCKHLPVFKNRNNSDKMCLHT